MNPSVWLGFSGIALLGAWAMANPETGRAFLNLHGWGMVLGGTALATLVSCPFPILFSAFRALAGILLPSRVPSPEAVVEEMVRLARRSQLEGGLLALRDEGREFAEGFLHRALSVAIATGESAETRRILESEIRALRVSRQEDANVFRSIGVLAPMFGLLGTLLGMVRVLAVLSDPTQVGPAMAAALSSAFVGIGLSNLFCIPIAGQLRLAAMGETLALSMVIDGVLAIAAGKPAYLVELQLAAYSAERRRQLEAAEAEAPRGAPARPTPAPGP